jgi:hypothetical protein
VSSGDTNKSVTGHPPKRRMAAHGAFTADEIGTGNRATLTPSDRAFLESPPTYEEGGSLLPEPEPPRVELRTPSPERRRSSLLLFVAITGSACVVLGLAALRLVGSALSFW